MKDKPLANVRVAILATNDFEQSEMTEPRQALMEAGAQTTLIAPELGKLQAMKHDMKADYFDVDLVLERANPADFDAVMLPGGALNADALRVDQKAREFIRRIDEAGKPIAVICHGSWLLVSAGLTKGRTLTSYTAAHYWWDMMRGENAAKPAIPGGGNVPLLMRGCISHHHLIPKHIRTPG